MADERPTALVITTDAEEEMITCFTPNEGETIEVPRRVVEQIAAMKQPNAVLKENAPPIVCPCKEGLLFIVYVHLHGEFYQPLRAFVSPPEYEPPEGAPHYNDMLERINARLAAMSQNGIA